MAVRRAGNRGADGRPPCTANPFTAMFADTANKQFGAGGGRPPD